MEQFVCTDKSRRSNEFSYKEKRLFLRTLGGKERDICGKVYACQVRDLKQRIYHFKVHRLDKVMGYLGGVPTSCALQKLFVV